MKLRRKRLCRLVLLVVVLLLAPPSSSAWADRFVVTPKVSATWRTDSNYFKDDDDVVDDCEVYTYLVRPGFDLGYKTAKSQVIFGYTTDLYFYDKKDSAPPGEDVSDFVGHTLNLKARTKPTARLTVGLDESYYRTRDPSQTDVVSNRAVRRKYWINRIGPVVYYDFGAKFTAGARYRRTDLNYTSSWEEDSTEHRGIFDLIYNLTSTASLDLEYQHWEMRYDDDGIDYKSDQVQLIFRKAYKYFKFDVGGGYHWRRFDESDKSNIGTPSYQAGFRGEKGRSHIDFHAYRNYNNYYDEDDYYVATRFVLEVGHIFAEKVPVAVRGGYQDSDYEEFEGFTKSGKRKKRDDDTWGIQGSIGYIFTDWLKATATAGYEDRDSNVIGYDYDNKYTMITLDFAYDIGGE
jgi:hypothetical protein